MEKNELPWTDGEIIAHYRQAANQYAIIGILADLNDVSRERICTVLKRNGITPPTKRTKKKQSFKRNHYILVAEDGTRYTTGELDGKQVMRSQIFGTKRTRKRKSRLTACGIA